MRVADTRAHRGCVNALTYAGRAADRRSCASVSRTFGSFAAGMKRAAYRIETPRLLLRPWLASDAAANKRMEDACRPHLSEFMTWIGAEPVPLSAHADKLRRFRAAFDTDDDYFYVTTDRETGAFVGACGLHDRVGVGGLEIGYWTHVDCVGRGLATEAAGALTRVALEAPDLHFVEIRCAVSNVVSQKIPPKLGYVHEATLRQRLPTPSGVHADALVYTLLGDAYAASPAKAMDVAAYDASDVRMF